ncbi:hypothetical protein FRC07_013789, partial [Ceratobasidium sp. 392]
MTTLQDIDKKLKESLKASAPQIDIAAIDSLTKGRPYHIGQKDQPEDLIDSILIWTTKQAQDSAVK